MTILKWFLSFVFSYTISNYSVVLSLNKDLIHQNFRSHIVFSWQTCMLQIIPTCSFQILHPYLCWPVCSSIVFISHHVIAHRPSPEYSIAISPSFSNLPLTLYLLDPVNNAFEVYIWSGPLTDKKLLTASVLGLYGWTFSFNCWKQR